MAEVVAAPAATGRHQRSFKNYLLDSHFQLKYTAYLVGIAFVLSASLGVVLWRTSRSVIQQSEEAVAQSDQVVKFGSEVVGESQKVSAVVRMNIVKDTEYSDNPDLLAAFNKDADAQDQKLKDQQAKLEAQSSALKLQRTRLEMKQSATFTSLFAVLTLLVLGIGVAGILVTHKVAGPIFKMKRQIADVGAGHLKMPSKLRKGDELVHFFEAFESMVASLRKRQEHEIDLLDKAISQLEGRADAGALEPLHALRADMKAALD